MALNRVPVFANIPKTVMVEADTAETGLEGTTNHVTVYANATGASVRISSIRMKALGNTTASMVRLLLYDGSVTKVWREYLTSSITASATVKSWETEESADLYLQNGWALRATTHGGDDIMVFANVEELDED